MAAAGSPGDPRVSGEEATPPATSVTERVPAWELVEAGRYRPLRTRGSFPGRELG
jgi:hypothetical protein